MMSDGQAIFLAIVQGLTEFLPISSSGHLVVFQKLFGLEPPVLFDVLVHVGTLGAVLIFFRKELLTISRRTIELIVIGTLPAAVVGLFLENYLEQIFNSLSLVGLTLFVTAGLLFSIRRQKSFSRHFNQLKWLDAFLVGCFQALAILPGISRSGATIVAGLWRRFDRQTAFRFSFYLAIPAILGALVLQLPDLITSPGGYLKQSLLGMLLAGLTGYWSLKILKEVLTSNRLWLFGFYCLFLATLLFFSPF